MTHQQQLADRLAQLRREKSAREHRDVLQSEIAEAAGTSVVTYGRYENGRRKIPEEVIEALAGYYGVTPAYIRYGFTGQASGAQAAGEPPAQPTVRKTYTPEEIEEFRRIVAEEAEPQKSSAAHKPAPKRGTNGR